MDKLIFLANNGKMICSSDEWCMVSIFTSHNTEVTGYERRTYLFKTLFANLQKNENPVILINQIPYRYVCSLSDPYTAIYFSFNSMNLLFIPDKLNVTLSKNDNGVECVSINDPITLHLSKYYYIMWIKKLKCFASNEKMPQWNKWFGH